MPKTPRPRERGNANPGTRAQLWLTLWPTLNKGILGLEAHRYRINAVANTEKGILGLKAPSYRVNTVHPTMNRGMRELEAPRYRVNTV